MARPERGVARNRARQKLRAALRCLIDAENPISPGGRAGLARRANLCSHAPVPKCERRQAGAGSPCPPSTGADFGMIWKKTARRGGQPRRAHFVFVTIYDAHCGTTQRRAEDNIRSPFLQSPMRVAQMGDQECQTVVFI